MHLRHGAVFIVKNVPVALSFYRDRLGFDMMIVGVAYRGLRRVLDRAMAEFSGRHEVRIRGNGAGDAVR
jgi:hypothetical protein